MSKQPPTNCPTCDGHEINHYGDQYDSGTHFDYVGCDSCDTRWTEVYEFSRIEITKESNLTIGYTGEQLT